MINVKMYGLGGQGMVTAARILAEAVSINEGKYAVVVPSYGSERRGAPVDSSLIIDDDEIFIISFVYEPDIVIVSDSSIIEKGVDISKGIHNNSILVLNTDEESVLEEYKKFNFKEIYYADATNVALENIGVGIPNASMLGILARSGIVTIESIVDIVQKTLDKKGESNNANSSRCAYERTKKI